MTLFRNKASVAYTIQILLWLSYDDHHDWYEHYKCVLLLALASVVNYDRKWCLNLEQYLLKTLEASFTIVICL